MKKRKSMFTIIIAAILLVSMQIPAAAAVGYSNTYDEKEMSQYIGWYLSDLQDQFPGGDTYAARGFTTVYSFGNPGPGEYNELEFKCNSDLQKIRSVQIAENDDGYNIYGITFHSYLSDADDILFPLDYEITETRYNEDGGSETTYHNEALSYDLYLKTDSLSRIEVMFLFADLWN